MKTLMFWSEDHNEWRPSAYPHTLADVDRLNALVGWEMYRWAEAVAA